MTSSSGQHCAKCGAVLHFTVCTRCGIHAPETSGKKGARVKAISFGVALLLFITGVLMHTTWDMLFAKPTEHTVASLTGAYAYSANEKVVVEGVVRNISEDSQKLTISDSLFAENYVICVADTRINTNTMGVGDRVRVKGKVAESPAIPTLQECRYTRLTS